MRLKKTVDKQTGDIHIEEQNDDGTRTGYRIDIVHHKSLEKGSWVDATEVILTNRTPKGCKQGSEAHWGEQEAKDILDKLGDWKHYDRKAADGSVTGTFYEHHRIDQLPLIANGMTDRPKTR